MKKSRHFIAYCRCRYLAEHTVQHRETPQPPPAPCEWPDDEQPPPDPKSEPEPELEQQKAETTFLVFFDAHFGHWAPSPAALMLCRRENFSLHVLHMYS